MCKFESWIFQIWPSCKGGGETRLGIYELDGDRGTACFASIGSKDRPKDLATKADGHDYLWKFQRD